MIGDIHGAHKALIQCLERSSFDYEKDTLISLGDVADGWSQVPECFEELRKVKNLIFVMGNHDDYLREWLKFGSIDSNWLKNGGQTSIDAYEAYRPYDIRHVHEKMLDKSVFYYEMDNMLFVHGGYDWHNPISEAYVQDLMWDRHMWITAYYWQRQYDKGNDILRFIGDYDNVFIGHTTTSHFDKTLNPVKLSNVWNIDQGAGYYGKLTIMDIDTKEYWQSDQVQELYPDEKGRRG